MNEHVVPFLNTEDGTVKRLKYVSIRTEDINELQTEVNAKIEDGYYVEYYQVTRYFGRFVFSIRMEKIIDEDPSIIAGLPTMKFVLPENNTPTP